MPDAEIGERKKAEERSLHPGEARGAHKSRCAARRARSWRGRESRAASAGMTGLGKAGWSRAEGTEFAEKS